MKQDFDKEIKKKETKIKIVRIFGFIILSAGFIPLFHGFFYVGGEYNELGDYIGGVSGALWSLAGLLFIYMAFLGQQIEIHYQREELVETRNVFTKQSEIMVNQQNDNTFFNLLANHRQLVESYNKTENKHLYYGNGRMSHSELPNNVTGYENFANVSNDILTYLFEYTRIVTTNKCLHYKQQINDPLEILKNELFFHTHFDEVVNIIEFIQNRFSEDNQAFYINTFIKNLRQEEINSIIMLQENIYRNEKIKQLSVFNYYSELAVFRDLKFPTIDYINNSTRKDVSQCTIRIRSVCDCKFNVIMIGDNIKEVLNVSVEKIGEEDSYFLNIDEGLYNSSLKIMPDKSVEHYYDLCKANVIFYMRIDFLDFKTTTYVNMLYGNSEVRIQKELYKYLHFSEYHSVNESEVEEIDNLLDK